MSPAAMALLAFFIGVSIVSGLLAWRAIGPRRWYGLPLPVLAPFVALYLAGHQFAVQVGPTVELLGFEVALLFDLTLALVAALVAAFVQRPLLAALIRADRG
jgi:hypothetical protein